MVKGKIPNSMNLLLVGADLKVSIFFLYNFLLISPGRHDKMKSTFNKPIIILFKIPKIFV